MNQKPWDRLDRLSALNALDLAVESQRMQAEVHDFLIALLPLLREVEKLSRAVAGAPEHDPYVSGILRLADRAADLKTKMGLAPIGTIDEVVDPIRYEVVDTFPREDRNPGTVLEVVESGWSFRGITIQRARVAASIKPGQLEQKGS